MSYWWDDDGVRVRVDLRHLTRQEALDIMVRGLAGQGWRRAANPLEECRYRMQTGDTVLRCAVGHLSDDLATYQCDAYTLIHSGVLQVADGEMREFLVAMQEIHDLSSDSTLRDGVMKLTEQLGLKWPEGY